MTVNSKINDRCQLYKYQNVLYLNSNSVIFYAIEFNHYKNYEEFYSIYISEYLKKHIDIVIFYVSISLSFCTFIAKFIK